MPTWPVAGRSPSMPTALGSFGAVRSGGARRHAGLDLHADEGATLVATEAGTIVATQGWDGPQAKAVLLQTDRGPVVLYGAVVPGSWPRVGTHVEEGQRVASVGRYPGGSSMLHIELYREGTRRNSQWPVGSPRPSGLIDPTSYFSAIVTGRPVPAGRRRRAGFALPLLALGAGLAYGLAKR